MEFSVVLGEGGRKRKKIGCGKERKGAGISAGNGMSKMVVAFTSTSAPFNNWKICFVIS